MVHIVSIILLGYHDSYITTMPVKIKTSDKI